MKLKKEDALPSTSSNRGNPSKGSITKSSNIIGPKKTYKALFNDIDDLDDYSDCILPHQHAGANFEPPPVGRDIGGNVAPPWLGLHLEQQTVMMEQWATERRAMTEENDRLRRLLAEAEERIQGLLALDVCGGDLASTDCVTNYCPYVECSDSSGNKNNNNASASNGHNREKSISDNGSVCSAATTVVAGTAASKSVFAFRGRVHGGSGLSTCMGISRYSSGIQSSDAEAVVGARRTAERCKEGQGGGGQGKKNKKLFFGRKSFNSQAVKTIQERRSRSYSPTSPRERRKHYDRRDLMVTRAEEEYYGGIIRTPTSSTDDDDHETETVGISDHTVSPPSTPGRTRPRSLSPTLSVSPRSRELPSSKSMISSRGQGRKEVYRSSRQGNQLVRRKKTQVLYYTSPKRILISKVTGISGKTGEI